MCGVSYVRFGSSVLDGLVLWFWINVSRPIVNGGDSLEKQNLLIFMLLVLCVLECMHE